MCVVHRCKSPLATRSRMLMQDHVKYCLSTSSCTHATSPSLQDASVVNVAYWSFSTLAGPFYRSHKVRPEEAWIRLSRLEHMHCNVVIRVANDGSFYIESTGESNGDEHEEPSREERWQLMQRGTTRFELTLEKIKPLTLSCTMTGVTSQEPSRYRQQVTSCLIT